MGEKDENRKPDDPEQSKRFEETAKRLDTDESGATFERAMDVIASDTPDKKSSEGGKKRTRHDSESD
jgi:hypothetical protein